jgi:Holliday junction resolvasome RuvABC endonuclease subunit
MVKKQYRILCIDPALSSCGWSILDLMIDQCKKTSIPKIVVYRTSCFKSYNEAIKAANRVEANFFGKPVLGLSILIKNMTQLIELYKPDFVVIEDAFFNPKRPNAYASLISCIVTISQMCRNLFKLPVYRVPTRSAKASIAMGGAKKVDVQKAVLENPNITFKQKKSREMLNDHEADSIAVGHFFITSLLPGIVPEDYFGTIEALKGAVK